jgi:hypothetical protein
MKNQPVDKIESWLDTKSKEQIAALRNNPEVAPRIAALKAAQRGDSVSDSLLSELDDETETETADVSVEEETPAKKPSGKAPVGRSPSPSRTRKTKATADVSDDE